MAFSSIIMLPLLLLFLAIWAGLIYLLILLIRALRKYLRGGEAGTADPRTSNLLALAKLVGVPAEELLHQATGGGV